MRPHPPCWSWASWGNMHKSIAFEQYCQQYICIYTVSFPENLHKSGILISKHGFLAASPDGSVYAEGETVGVVEINCPYACRNMSDRDGCRNIKSFCCELSEDEHVSLKKVIHITIKFKEKWQWRMLNGVTSLCGQQLTWQCRGLFLTNSFETHATLNSILFTSLISCSKLYIHESLHNYRHS